MNIHDKEFIGTVYKYSYTLHSGTSKGQRRRYSIWIL